MPDTAKHKKDKRTLGTHSTTPARKKVVKRKPVPTKVAAKEAAKKTVAKKTVKKAAKKVAKKVTQKPVKRVAKKKATKKPVEPRRYYGPMIHALEDLYANLDDDALIVELSTDPSLRRYAKNAIDSLATKGGYHQAVLYYLTRRRPGLMAQLDKEAAELSAAWPQNWKTLQKSMMIGGWWATSLTRRFRQELRERMRGCGAKEWLDTIWPAALQILETHDAPLVASELEKVITGKLLMPSAFYKDWKMIPMQGRGPARIQAVGGNLWLKLRKQLRHKLIEHFKLPSRASKA